jgi:hypothetical protein
VSDGYIPRRAVPLAPVLDLYTSSQFCDFQTKRGVLVRYAAADSEYLDCVSNWAFRTNTGYGPLGSEGIGAFVPIMATRSGDARIDTFGELEEWHDTVPGSHWLLPRSALPPQITGYTNDPPSELPLPAGGTLAASDLDGDGLEEILRLDDAGTLHFADMTTGRVGQMDLPMAANLRLDLGVRSVIDHDADLCAYPRPMLPRPGFAIATSVPSGLIVYRPTCSGP